MFRPKGSSMVDCLGKNCKFAWHCSIQGLLQDNDCNMHHLDNPAKLVNCLGNTLHKFYSSSSIDLILSCMGHKKTNSSSSSRRTSLMMDKPHMYCLHYSILVYHMDKVYIHYLYCQVQVFMASKF